MTEFTRKQSASTQKKSGGFAEVVRTLLYAVIIAVGFRTFAYEPFNIPSSSMVPTLLVGDYLFVSKFTYGYSKYTVGLGLPLFDGRILGSEPERGDVAVFKQPRDNRTDYIKRIVGMPGDRIQVTDGILHINGEPVQRERVEEEVAPDEYGRLVRATVYRETLPNGREHLIREISDAGPYDNTREFVVPERHYFMMGDNRDNSADSREFSTVGYVPEENLVGRAEFLFLSLDDARIWEIWKWPFALRFSRLLDGVV
ncbi:signal peptidase I [Arenibaculum sp.]|uniref:signal peptidase I n=1 Tax=Arenibaculum sp. TaxID=2865862 RepID=UPI002E11DA30|nr:signal peptidase I [Arenibaculum sp.]